MKEGIACLAKEGTLLLVSETSGAVSIAIQRNN